MTGARRPTIAVVGAGIAGLAAAWELVTSPSQHGGPAFDVQVYEASDRIGGKLRSAPFGGRTVDLAADAFLARRPEATDLCHELGLDDQLVPVGASGASIWARGELRPMPTGLHLGIPTRWWPLVRSGIVSPTEAARLSRDLLGLHRGSRPPTHDRSVGDIVGTRLGRAVVERLADPLIGGINAGGVDDLSAAATFPPLLDASRQSGSLMRRLGQARPPAQRSPNDEDSPVFWSLATSTAGLAEELARALVALGVTIHTRTAVASIASIGHRSTGSAPWRLDLSSDQGVADREAPVSDRGRAVDADGLVLATPAPDVAVLLAPHAPGAARLLRAIEYSSVAVVTLILPVETAGAPRYGTGFLVPRTSTVGGHPALITGCTYLGRKWPHLARPGDELVRVSVGRFGDTRHRELGDDELIEAAFGELTELLGLRGRPIESMVTRWDGAFPQYRVGHLDAVDGIDAEIATLTGVAVAGAAYRGVGIPACIDSGRSAARRVLASLALPGR